MKITKELKADLGFVHDPDADRLVTNYRVENDPLSVAENNHEKVTATAIFLENTPIIRNYIPTSLPGNAWRLAPPPGRIITLPSGAPMITAHFMVNVLNLMSTYGLLGTVF